MSRKSGKEVAAVVSGMGVFVAFITRLVELVKKFGGTMESIYRLATPEGEKTLEAVARLIVDGAGEMAEKTKKVFLRLISAGENLTIDACDGTEILADARDVFAGIDPDFENWGADEPGASTAKTPVDVHEMENNGTFIQMFGSLNPDLDRLCFTQAQIKGFVRKYRSWLRTEGYATFFLFKSHGHFFVANVFFYSDDSLGVYVVRLERGLVWFAGYRRRIVVPKLA